MTFLIRRIVKSLLLTALVGMLIRKGMESSNPKLSAFAKRTNRLLGGFVGLDETGHPAPRRRRRTMAGSAGSAVVGGAMSYFFDPRQGRERRERAVSFAKRRIDRNGSTRALPAATETTGDAPYGAPRANVSG